MKICITVSEMSQLQWHLGEGNIKQRSFIVDIPNESLPQGLQEFLRPEKKIQLLNDLVMWIR